MMYSVSRRTALSLLTCASIVTLGPGCGPANLLRLPFPDISNDTSTSTEYDYSPGSTSRESDGGSSAGAGTGSESGSDSGSGSQEPQAPSPAELQKASLLRLADAYIGDGAKTLLPAGTLTKGRYLLTHVIRMGTVSRDGTEQFAYTVQHVLRRWGAMGSSDRSFENLDRGSTAGLSYSASDLRMKLPVRFTIGDDGKLPDNYKGHWYNSSFSAYDGSLNFYPTWISSGRPDDESVYFDLYSITGDDALTEKTSAGNDVQVYDGYSQRLPNQGVVVSWVQKGDSAREITLNYLLNIHSEIGDHTLHQLVFKRLRARR